MYCDIDSLTPFFYFTIIEGVGDCGLGPTWLRKRRPRGKKNTDLIKDWSYCTIGKISSLWGWQSVSHDATYSTNFLNRARSLGPRSYKLACQRTVKALVTRISRGLCCSQR